MPPDDLGNHNIKSLDGNPLCIECLSCGRRVLRRTDELKLTYLDHEMTSLAYLARRMRCSVCGSGSVKVQRARTAEDGRAWLAGNKGEARQAPAID